MTFVPEVPQIGCLWIMKMALCPRFSSAQSQQCAVWCRMERCACHTHRELQQTWCSMHLRPDAIGVDNDCEQLQPRCQLPGEGLLMHG